VAITSLHVAGYRSVREVRLALDRVNVLVGPNGCGKTHLDRTPSLPSVPISASAG
jgi:predicted ATPase